MTKHIKSYKKELRLKDGQLRKESDYVKVDDTWIQLSKLMLYPFREQFQKERMQLFTDKQKEEYMMVAF